MEDLFTNTNPGAQVLTRAAKAPKAKNRLEYYFNGLDCKAPVTPYGLLWDINNSAARINFNSHLIDIDWVAENCDNAGLTEAEQQHIQHVAQFYCELGTKSNHIMFGKVNKMAGTGAHNLTAGIKDFRYGYAAIMTVTPGIAPDVWLYDHGTWITLTSGWTGVPYSSNPAKLYQVKW